MIKAFVGADTAVEGNEDPAVGRSDGTDRPWMEVPMELSDGPSMPPAPADESTEDDGPQIEINMDLSDGPRVGESGPSPLSSLDGLGEAQL